MAAFSFVGALPWQCIPQEPGSLYIGNFRAPQHLVAHTLAVEPLVDGPGLHITVTPRTDIFATDRVRAGPEPTTDHLYNPLGGLVNMAVPRFVSVRPPRMPSLTGVIALLGAA